MFIEPTPGFILSILIGLLLGSFATAITYRVPRGQSWIATKGKAEHSGCPACGHRLSWRDLLPVLSWVFLRGRCRYCRAAIGWRYPAIEISTLLVCVSFYLAFGWTAAGIIAIMAAPFLVALVAIDLEHMILPDQINLILGGLGLSWIFAVNGLDDPVNVLLAGIIGAGVYTAVSFVTSWVLTRVLKKDAMGFGDVKFFAVAGLWLGLPLFAAFLMLAGVAGLALGLLWKFAFGQDRFPFGPALVLSFLLCLLFMPQIMTVFY